VTATASGRVPAARVSEQLSAASDPVRETQVLLRWLADENSTDWQELGACQDADPKIFFPVAKVVTITLDDDVTTDTEEVEADYPTDEAKAICNFCPVKDICLSWALKDRTIEGTWGGTSTYQRDQLRRRRERKSCPGCTSQTIIHSGRTQLCLACGVSWPA
jgi:WhiB family transcriptional regulator, redox-sensing transcriptional regulator